MFDLLLIGDATAVQLSPWAQFGLAGLVIGCLMVGMGIVGKWLLSHIDKKDNEHRAEREAVIAEHKLERGELMVQFKAERDVIREEHRLERQEWLKAVRETSEKIVSAVDRLSQTVKDHE